MIEEVCIGCWTKLEGGYSHRFWKPTRSWEPRHGETSGVENTAGGMYNAAPRAASRPGELDKLSAGQEVLATTRESRFVIRAGIHFRHCSADFGVPCALYAVFTRRRL